MFLVIEVPKNSNFGQNLNFSEKSKKFMENQNTNRVYCSNMSQFWADLEL
jgi:hypothetical protein